MTRGGGPPPAGNALLEETQGAGEQENGERMETITTFTPLRRGGQPRHRPHPLAAPPFLAAMLALLLCWGTSPAAWAQKGGGGGGKQSPPKKMIELGWDIPDTAYMRANIAQMEQSPFDGVIFFAYYTRPDGTGANFSRSAWSNTNAIPPAALQPAIDDLKATPFQRFTDNFLRVDVVPGDIDWFGDLSAFLQNINLAARVAHDGGAKGLFLDTEQYTWAAGRPFDYPRQPYASTKSFDQYVAQVRAQAKRVMQQIQAAYPDLTILLSHGASYTWMRMDYGAKPLQGIGYDLLPAFLNGLIDGAQGGTKIIDGFEPSFYFDTLSQFDDAYTLIKQGCLPLIANPKKYASYVSVGFGLWMDRDWDTDQFNHTWNLTDFTQNYYTPAEFDDLTTKALQRSDRYAWIYSQNPNWWTGQNVPAEYASALLDAKTRANATH
jgi:hypothetical protein